MSKLSILSLAILVATTSISMAQPHRLVRNSGYAYGWSAPTIASEQQKWPGRTLCDDGGYRIRPCDIGGGRGG